MKKLLLAIVLAGCPAQKPPQRPVPVSVTLSGKVHQVGPACQGGKECDGPAIDYEVVILAKDGKTEVARAKTDATGAYNVQLPAGEYTVVTPAGMQQTKRNDVTLVAGTPATLDLELDSGAR